MCSAVTHPLLTAALRGGCISLPAPWMRALRLREGKSFARCVAAPGRRSQAGMLGPSGIYVLRPFLGTLVLSCVQQIRKGV